MPGRDGTGPLGQGAMLGGGRGRGMGLGRGMVAGARCQRRFSQNCTALFSEMTQKEFLSQQKEILQRRIQEIDQEVDKL